MSSLAHKTPRFAWSFSRSLERVLIDVDQESSGVPITYFVDTSAVYGAIFPFADFQSDSSSRSLRDIDGREAQHWMVRTHLIAGTIGTIRLLGPHFGELIDITARPNEAFRQIVKKGLLKSDAIHYSENQLNALIQKASSNKSSDILIDDLFREIARLSLGTYSVLEAMSNRNLVTRWRSIIRGLAQRELGTFSSIREIEQDKRAIPLVDFIRISRKERFPSHSSIRDGAALLLLGTLIADSVEQSDKVDPIPIQHRFYCESKHLMRCCLSAEFRELIPLAIQENDVDSRIIRGPLEMLIRCVFQSLQFPSGTHPFAKMSTDDDNTWLVNLTLEELKELVQLGRAALPPTGQPLHDAELGDEKRAATEKLLKVASSFSKVCLNGMFLLQEPSLRRISHYYKDVATLDGFTTQHHPGVTKRLNKEHETVRTQQKAARFMAIYSHRIGLAVEHWKGLDISDDYAETHVLGVFPYTQLNEMILATDECPDDQIALAKVQRHILQLNTPEDVVEAIRYFLSSEEGGRAGFLMRALTAIVLDIPTYEVRQTSTSAGDDIVFAAVRLLEGTSDDEDINCDLVQVRSATRSILQSTSLPIELRIRALIGLTLLLLNASNASIWQLATSTESNRLLRIANRIIRLANSLYWEMKVQSHDRNQLFRRELTILLAILDRRSIKSLRESKMTLDNLSVTRSSYALLVARCLLVVRNSKGGNLEVLTKTSTISEPQQVLIREAISILNSIVAPVGSIDLPVFRRWHSELKEWVIGTGFRLTDE